MNNPHLAIGGSTAVRTLACPAWVGRAKLAPKTKSSTAADVGNLIHDVLEVYYRDGVSLLDQLGKTTFGDFTFGEEHLQLTQDCITATEQVLDDYDVSDYICEPFVQIEPGEVGGSIDLLAVSADRSTVVVLDYKTGVGKVTATDNKSILFYTLAASLDPSTAHLFASASRFVSAIVQPRCYGTKADVWEFDNNTLDTFALELDAAVTSARSDSPDAKAGSHCRYCPAIACPESRAAIRSATLLDPSVASDLAEALTMMDRVKDWLKDLETVALSTLEQGGMIEGWKLVQKRPVKRWADEEQARVFLTEHLNDAATVTKVITPAQAEGLIKKAKLLPQLSDNLSNLIVSESSGVTLAPASDKRTAVSVPENPDNLINFIDNV